MTASVEAYSRNSKCDHESGISVRGRHIGKGRREWLYPNGDLLITDRYTDGS